MNEILKPAREEAAFGSWADLSLTSRIYCGRAIPQNQRVDLGSCTGRYVEVTDSGVARFLREVVAKHFPDGFTVFRTEGGWTDTETGAVIAERSFVIEVAHGPKDLGRISAVAEEWKRLAKQQAVMVSTSRAATTFL